MASRALLAVGVLGLLATAPMAAAGTGWSAPELLGSGRYLSAPATGVDGQGRTIVAWSQPSVGGEQVVARTLTGWVWGESKVLAGAGGSTPRVSASPTNVSVAWVDSGALRIVARVGTVWDAPRSIDMPSVSRACRDCWVPHVNDWNIDAEGNAFATWYQDDEFGYWTLYEALRRVDDTEWRRAIGHRWYSVGPGTIGRDGLLFSGQRDDHYGWLQVNALFPPLTQPLGAAEPRGYAGYPPVFAYSNSGRSVIYAGTGDIRYQGAGDSIQVGIRTPSDAWWDTVAPGESWGVVPIAVATDDAGNAAVAWQHPTDAAGVYRARVRTGAGWGTAAEVITPAAQMSQFLHLATMSGGRQLAAWATTTPSGDVVIEARIHDGSEWSSTMTVAALPVTRELVDLDIVAAGGEGVVVWKTRTNDLVTLWAAVTAAAPPPPDDPPPPDETRPVVQPPAEQPLVTPPATPVAPAGGVTPQLVRGGAVAVNRGAPFAKRRFVQLTIESPAGATEAVVANAASFATSRRIVLSRSPQTVWWTLPVDGPARAPRTVYVRFVGQGLDTGYAVSDGIVLDRTAPRVGSVRVATAGRQKVALRVTGTDAVSGIDVVEWRAGPSSPIRGGLYGERLLVPRALRSVLVRVVDRADNASTWRRVALPGPDRV